MTTQRREELKKKHVRASSSSARKRVGTRKPLWDYLGELGSALPDNELERLPTDLSIRLDTYLAADVEPNA